MSSGSDNGSRKPRGDAVICPACTHQFQGVPLDVQFELNRCRDALEQIQQWAEAYPLAMFPEPHWPTAAAGLKAVGITLDAVSASNMRHVITRVQEIAERALGTKP